MCHDRGRLFAITTTTAAATTSATTAAAVFIRVRSGEWHRYVRTGWTEHTRSRTGGVHKEMSQNVNGHFAFHGSFLLNVANWGHDAPVIVEFVLDELAQGALHMIMHLSPLYLTASMRSSSNWADDGG